MSSPVSHLILVCDLDGSLLTSEKKVSPAVTSAIQQLRSDGGKITVATGRPLETAKQYLDIIQPDLPVILYNGSLIKDYATGEILLQHGLPLSAASYAKWLLDSFPEIGAEVLRTDGVYAVSTAGLEKAHISICRITPTYCTCQEVSHTPELPWLKVVFAALPEQLNALCDFAQQHPCPGTYLVRSAPILLELLPEGVNKGSALRALKTFPSLPPDAFFAALGDYDNDIAMLQEAHLGFAPSNAQDCVKKAANVVLNSSCDQDAAAEMISYLYHADALTSEHDK